MVLLFVAALMAAARFGVAVYRAPTSAVGDFHATLPGGYVKTLNPTLWNSPDLITPNRYPRDGYMYGPTQYLLLYPIAFLNSYEQIARVLGVVYAGVLGWTLYLMSALLAGRRHLAWTPLVVIAVVLLFPPSYQAYIQREFEIVVFLFLVASACMIASGWDAPAGGLLGIITWFKIWPIAFLGYLLVTNRSRGVAAFIIASCVTLGAAQLLFGLDRFLIFNPAAAVSESGRAIGVGIMRMAIPLWEPAAFIPGPGGFIGLGSCEGWASANTTLIGMRWAACRLAFSYRWLSPLLVLSLIGLAMGATAGLGIVYRRRGDESQRWRLPRGRPFGFWWGTWRRLLSEDERRWSVVCEVSLVTIASALLLHAHYYYFIYLTLPISALATRYLSNRQWIRLGCLALAYWVLSIFLLPSSTTIPRLGGNIWKVYMEHVVYLYGELIVILLLLFEYTTIGLGSRDRSMSPALQR
jgi:hypothetical protein